MKTAQITILNEDMAPKLSNFMRVSGSGGLHMIEFIFVQGEKGVTVQRIVVTSADLKDMIDALTKNLRPQEDE